MGRLSRAGLEATLREHGWTQDGSIWRKVGSEIRLAPDGTDDDVAALDHAEAARARYVSYAAAALWATDVDRR